MKYNIFERKVWELEDVFKIESFERNALVIFRNATSVKSQHDLSFEIEGMFDHIKLPFNVKRSPLKRFGRVEIFKDPKTSIDIITVFTRLLDGDLNDESGLRDGEIIEEFVYERLEQLNHYSRFFIEFDYQFDYEWIYRVEDKMNQKLFNLVTVEGD